MEKICPHCNENEVIKYGKLAGSHKQRYRCKRCGKYFSNNTEIFKYAKREKRIFWLLNYLISNNFYYKVSLLEALNAPEFKLAIKNCKPNVTLCHIPSKNKAPKKIECYNPKALICLQNNKLVIHSIPDCQNNDILIENRYDNQI